MFVIKLYVIHFSCTDLPGLKYRACHVCGSLQFDSFFSIVFFFFFNFPQFVHYALLFNKLDGDLSLGFKDDFVSVLLSVDSGMALQPLSGSAELEAGGTLEGHCHGWGRSSSVAMIVGYSCSALCSFSSNAFAVHVSTHQQGGPGLLL